MASLYVTVTQIDSITPHSNADALELAVIGGWQCVVAKGKHKPGDTVVYFPPDTVIPKELSDKLNVTKYLSNGRIKCAKLRGEPSFGLIIYPEPHMSLGDDVAQYYGATKWEPPTRRSQGSSMHEIELFPRYTDLDNMRHFPNAFNNGEEVIATEKIHGANCRIGIVNGEYMAGSRKLRRKQDDSCLYWKPLTNVKRLLDDLSKDHHQVILYGEVFGKGIQSLTYGTEFSFAAFDLLVDGKFLDYDEFYNTCYTYGVNNVPVIYRGPYSIDAIKNVSKGSSVVGGSHIREGVVVKPVYERVSPKVGRLILKYVSDDYLLGKHSDTNEE